MIGFRDIANKEWVNIFTTTEDEMVHRIVAEVFNVPMDDERLFRLSEKYKVDSILHILYLYRDFFNPERVDYWLRAVIKANLTFRDLAGMIDGDYPVTTTKMSKVIYKAEVRYGSVKLSYENFFYLIKKMNTRDTLGSIADQLYCPDDNSGVGKDGKYYEWRLKPSFH